MHLRGKPAGDQNHPTVLIEVKKYSNEKIPHDDIKRLREICDVLDPKLNSCCPLALSIVLSQNERPNKYLRKSKLDYAIIGLHFSKKETPYRIKRACKSIPSSCSFKPTSTIKNRKAHYALLLEIV